VMNTLDIAPDRCNSWFCAAGERGSRREE
jgi:hypothetical protein